MKKLMPVILVIAISMVVAGCSSGSSSRGNGGDNSSKEDVGEQENQTSGIPEMSQDDYDWKKFSGETINVMLNQHQYQEAMVKKIEDFENKTGIKVKYSVTSEDNYFDKLTTALNAKNGNPDVFMTGSYQIWEYAPSGYMQNLDKFFDKAVAPDYNKEDFFEGVINADKWDLKTGSKVGTGHLWALPIAFEMYTLTYNKRAFEKVGLDSPPKTFDELIDYGEKLNGWNGENSFGIGVRGTRSWATIHPGYMTSYTNAGAKDFVKKDGDLAAGVGSSESVEFTKKFAKMVNKAGPPDWSNYTWYNVASAIGSGKAAITYDADWHAFANLDDSKKESGNLAVAPPPTTKDSKESNMWVWSLAMNSSSKHKGASWLFMQYFTGKEFQSWGAKTQQVIDPPRKSIWEDEEFLERVNKIDGYKETFDQLIENSSIKFTPQPNFFEVTTNWAAALQEIVQGADPKDRMSQLQDTMTKAMNEQRRR